MSRVNNPVVLSLAFVVSVSLFDSRIHAAPLLVDVGSQSVRNNGSSNFAGVVGYRFTVNNDPAAQDPVVTRLGAWDGPNPSGTVGDGLEEATEVGLWRESDMSLLVSATIPVGTGGILIDEFRYTAVPTTTLSEGVGYVIGALVTTGGTAFVNTVQGDAVFSGIISGMDARFESGGALVFPTSDSGTPTINGFAGPNAVLFAAPIPEPAAAMPILMGMAWLCRRTRHRRLSKAVS